MLNRRLLRFKIFQALYSYYQTESDNPTVALKNLFTSLDKMHELLLRNLWAIVKIADIIDERFETSKQKFIQDNNNGNEVKRLSQNTGIQNTINNLHYQQLVRDYKINMKNDEDVLRKIARTIEDSKEYKEYCQTSDNEKDLPILKSIYKNYIYTNNVLLSLFEEHNMHWAHDQYYIGIILMTYMKKESFFNNPETPLPDTFKPLEFEDSETDKNFVKILFTTTIKHASEYELIINQYLENWEPERIALSDIIIMRMACAEILTFDQIPIKASLNEYIELSKTFSTPKSKIFVNGVLDKVISHYNREGKIEKTGRGLMDNS